MCTAIKGTTKSPCQKFLGWRPSRRFDAHLWLAIPFVIHDVTRQRELEQMLVQYYSVISTVSLGTRWQDDIENLWHGDCKYLNTCTYKYVPVTSCESVVVMPIR